MSLNTLLEGILEERVLRASAETGCNVTLCENSANMQVKVVGVPEAFTTIRMGGRSMLNHHPNLKQGAWKRICDYLLITRIDGEDHAILVELKKTLGSRGSPEEQLLRSGPLIDYLLAVCDLEEGKKLSRPKMSYVIIFEKVRLGKSTLRPNPSGQIDEMEYKTIHIRRFKGDDLEISDLIGL